MRAPQTPHKRAIFITVQCKTKLFSLEKATLLFKMRAMFVCQYESKEFAKGNATLKVSLKAK